MANTATNVSTGKPKISGGIYRAPIGTTLPTDATTALSSDFTSLGYIANGGVTHSFNLDTGDYRAWGGSLVLSILNSVTHTFQFGMVEVLGKTANETIYGTDNVTDQTGGGYKVSAAAEDMPEFVYVIELQLRGDRARRIVIPDGKVTAVGDIVYQDSDAVNYPVTITAQVDSTGHSHYEYTEAA